VFTTISLLTTLFVLAAIIAIPIAHGTRHSGELSLLGTTLGIQFATAIGILINCVAGVGAMARGEYCGGRIAVMGVFVWLAATVVESALGWLSY
jgi:hypothetical protein